MFSLVVLSILTILVPGLCYEDNKYERSDIPNACCFHYSSRKIRNVAACYETSSRCPKPGVIVITRGGRQFCVHPRNVNYCGIFLRQATVLQKIREYDPQTSAYADDDLYLEEEDI